MNKFLIYLLLLLLVSGCTFLEDKGDEPMFFTINSVRTQEINQTSNTHRILDVWAFADGTDLGVFTLPAVIPVLPSDTEATFLSFFAGIRKNGQVNDPLLYPFYKNIEIQRNLMPLGAETLDLEFEYRSNTVFALVEDFESNHVFTNDADNNDTTFLTLTDAEARSGNSSGHLHLSQQNPTIEVANSTPLPLPVDGNAVYAEIEIKSDIETVIGLIGVDGEDEFTNFIIVLVPQPEWKKIYLSLGETLALSGLNEYRLVIGASIENQTAQEGNIYIDNIKILHF